MLLTETYREQNRELHKAGSFGLRGHHYAPQIIHLARAVGSDDILDYGCGQRTLQKALSCKIKEYDPCIEGLDAPPEPADVVACTDVLEHIEPECLDAVLDDLKRVTKQAGFFSIDTRPAVKHLPDGRNAHLIQEPAEWWFPRLYARFSTVQIIDRLIRPEKSCGFAAIVFSPRA